MKHTLVVVACLTLGAGGLYVAQTFVPTQPVQGQAVVTPAVPKELTSYRDIVKKVLPAVVSIESQSKQGKQRNRIGDLRQPGQRRDLLGSDAPVPVDEDNPSRIGFGSGFIISSKGVVVTNNHVVEGADQALVQLSDGRKFSSRKIKTDPKTDLAIIELDAKQPLPYLDFGDSDGMEIGDRVLAIGAPFGLAGTVTHGIISSKGRSLKMNMYEDFLQTDAAINPGNSGGPLISLEGKVIGVNSAIKTRSGGFQGIGMAIASNLSKTIVNGLLKDGVVRRGYLGVGIQDVNEELAQELGLKEALGVRVTKLYPNAPGEKAGLKDGDVILKLGSKSIKDGRSLQHAVASLPLGKPIDVEVFRDGKKLTVKVTIEEQPRSFDTQPGGRSPEFKNPVPLDKLGLAIADLTPEWAEELGYSENVKGALIVTIDRVGLAGKAGLKPGQVILSVNGKAVTTAKSAGLLLGRASTRTGIELEVRDPKTGKKTVTLRDRDDD